MIRTLFVFLLSCAAAFGQARTFVTVSTNTTLAQGDILVWSGSAWVAVNKGTNGQTLTMSGTNVAWATPAGGSGAVDSVFGRTGDVTADGADYDDFYQGTNSLLTAVAGLGSNGLVARTGAGSAAARTITGDTEIVVSNGDGASGNPTLSIGAGITRDAEAASLFQPIDATLTAVAGASTTSDSIVYFSAADTAAVATFTSFGRSLVDDASASDARTTLGLAIGTNVQAWDADLDDLADGSLSGSKIGTGIDGGNITTGTVAEARIDSAIARVSSLADYALLASSNNFSETNNFSAPVNAATLTVNDDAYDATSWNGSTNVPTKNAIRDKIESISAAGTRYLLLTFGCASDNPADGATRYISVIQGLPPRTAASNGPMVVPVDGTVVGYHVSTHVNAGGGSELVNFYLRLNDTTDFGNETIAWDTNYKELVVSGLSQAVAAGDKLIVKMVYPTWATDPTTVRHFGWVLMEVD